MSADATLTTTKNFSYAKKFSGPPAAKVHGLKRIENSDSGRAVTREGLASNPPSRRFTFLVNYHEHISQLYVLFQPRLLMAGVDMISDTILAGMMAAKQISSYTPPMHKIILHPPARTGGRRGFGISYKPLW